VADIDGIDPIDPVNVADIVDKADVIVVGRALATAHSVAHTIAKNFISVAAVVKSRRRKAVNTRPPTSSRQQSYT
jgi:hypothetical protein